MVAVSRMYSGDQNLLDVVAGAAIGTAIGTMLWFRVLNRPAHSDDIDPARNA